MTHARAIIIFAMCYVLIWGEPALASNAVQLASQGRSAHVVTVSASASPQTRIVAGALADYLSRIAHAHFDVRVGDGSSGIAVGSIADFPKLFAQGGSLVMESSGEAYLLRSHTKGLFVLGTGEQGVEHAVWDLLYRLGYRQYFPGAKWEILPEKPNLAIDLDVQSRPDYETRLVWHAFGTWDSAKPAFEDWRRKNRLGSGVKLKFGHAYRGIYERNIEEFKRHPEYLCPKGAKGGVKFRISNPGLRRLVVEDALRQIAENPDVGNVSLEPSDGGGWCDEALPEFEIISDRALRLANGVAEALAARYPGKLVSMNAYNEHSPPPTLRAHPQVLVTVATAFRRGGYSQEELLDGWAAKVSRLGIREYYSVNPWDHDLPARARAGDVSYMKGTIPAFHAKGARSLSAESSDNWGPNGLGYFLAARMLWDVRDAENVDALIEEFLTNAFGSAKKPMRVFYRQLDGSQKNQVLSTQIGKMYHALHEARRLADTPAILARLDDLLHYTRYVDLYQQYVKARGAKRQVAVQELFKYAWRIRTSSMVHTRALPHVIGKHDKRVQLPDGGRERWEGGAEWVYWRSNEPFSREELAAIIEAGMTRYPVADRWKE
jgi:hypothetical protein